MTKVTSSPTLQALPGCHPEAFSPGAFPGRIRRQLHLPPLLPPRPQNDPFLQRFPPVQSVPALAAGPPRSVAPTQPLPRQNGLKKKENSFSAQRGGRFPPPPPRTPPPQKWLGGPWGCAELRVPRSSANKCLLKVATYAAQLEQYQKAVEIYEQVGTSAMDSPLLKYSAKEYFFKAALCHFCIDMLNAKLAVQKYEEMFPAFTDSRECKLVKKLLDAHEEQNVDAYTDAVKEYDSISRLDQWLTTMLLRIKKTIQGEEEDLR
uniref:Alpha-soluble NSF attachment protein n=1 Tax=Pavo cristatus TaxID=9049 RepID=A0A8C9FTF7_PAVCR